MHERTLENFNFFIVVSIVLMMFLNTVQIYLSFYYEYFHVFNDSLNHFTDIWQIILTFFSVFIIGICLFVVLKVIKRQPDLEKQPKVVLSHILVFVSVFCAFLVTISIEFISIENITDFLNYPYFILYLAMGVHIMQNFIVAYIMAQAVLKQEERRNRIFKLGKIPLITYSAD